MNQYIFKELGLKEYKEVWGSMMNYVLSRNQDDLDEVWFLEHDPIYTLGLGASEENVLDSGEIPVLRSDRGGQVTYHGPGQLIVYFIINVRRLGWGPKTLINNLEQLLIDAIAKFGIIGMRDNGKPGVFVEGKKIASIGLKIKRGFSYHGISLNVDMDLTPFNNINTCGYESLEVTHMKTYCNVTMNEVKKVMQESIENNLSPKLI